MISPMVPLYDSLAMLDARCISHYGMTGVQLMERAGERVTQAVLDLLEQDDHGHRTLPVGIIVLCGPGSNGGDGLVVARLLSGLEKEKKITVRVILTHSADSYQGDAAHMMTRLMDACPNLDVVVLSNDHADFASVLEYLPDNGIVVDGLFGTGLSRPLNPFLVQGVEAINQWRNESDGRYVISIDMPSGVSSALGKVLGAAITADKTVSFETEKLGHWLDEGKIKRGALRVESIGFLEAVFTDCPTSTYRLTQKNVIEALPPVDLQAHKYQRGHVAVMAGSEGMTGAANLVCQSVLQSGCGVATWVGPQALLSQPFLLPEVLTACMDHSNIEHTLGELKQVGALVAGPGCGNQDEFQQTLSETLLYCQHHDIPCVIDADGLTALAKLARHQGFSKSSCRSVLTVLTPHVGEAAFLLGVSTSDILNDLIGSARAIQQQYGGVVVLKASTMVVVDDNTAWVNPTGHGVLATAGSGDVLSGLIGSLLAQKRRNKEGEEHQEKMVVEAALVGVYVHGAVGEALSKRPSGSYGVSASTLLEILPVVLNQLQEQKG